MLITHLVNMIRCRLASKALGGVGFFALLRGSFRFASLPREGHLLPQRWLRLKEALPARPARHIKPK